MCYRKGVYLSWVISDLKKMFIRSKMFNSKTGTSRTFVPVAKRRVDDSYVIMIHIVVER
jgi:hypothetical protein